MKRIGIISLLLIMLPLIGLSAEDEALVRGHYTPGNLQLSADLGLAVYGTSGLALGLYPEAEFIITKFRPAGLFSIDLGAQGFARLGLDLGSTGGGFGLGAGGMVSFHLGLRGLDIPGLEFLSKTDIVSAFGLGFDISGARLVFAAQSGFQYFHSDSLVFRLMYKNFGGISEVTIGAGIKTGPPEEGAVAAIGEDISEARSAIYALEGEAAFLQFQSLYYSSLGYFGYGLIYAGELEDGAVWRVQSEEEEYFISRGTVARTSEGRWEKLVWESEGEQIDYEFLIDESGNILELRYRYPEARTQVYLPQEQVQLVPEDESGLTPEDYGFINEGPETVRVPAGRYASTRYSSSSEDESIIMWVSDDAPGGMVKYQYEDGSDTVNFELFREKAELEAELGVYN